MSIQKHLFVPFIMCLLSSNTSHMRFIGDISTKPGSFTISSYSSGPSISTPTFSSPQFGPFNTYGSATLYLNIQRCYVKSYCYFKLKKPGSSSYSYSTKLTNYTQDNTKGTASISIDLPFDDYFSNSGLIVDFFLYISSNNKLIISKSFTIFPKYSRSIVSSNYRTNDYEISNRIFTWNSDGPNDEKEVFSFKNSVSIVNDETYHHLSLNELYFNYYFSLKYPNYSQCYLYFYDTYYLFTTITTTRIIKVPLLLYFDPSLSKVYFRYKNTMYVEPSSLQMSLVKKEGYIETNKFYFPLNQKEKINTYNFKIEIKKMGQNETDVSIPFNYRSGKNLLGDCVDSDYCIIGGIRK